MKKFITVFILMTICFGCGSDKVYHPELHDVDTSKFKIAPTKDTLYVDSTRYFMAGYYAMEPSGSNSYSYGAYYFVSDTLPEVGAIKSKILNHIVQSGGKISFKRLTVISLTEFKNELEFNKWDK